MHVSTGRERRASLGVLWASGPGVRWGGGVLVRADLCVPVSDGSPQDRTGESQKNTRDRYRDGGHHTSQPRQKNNLCFYENKHKTSNRWGTSREPNCSIVWLLSQDQARPGSGMSIRSAKGTRLTPNGLYRSSLKLSFDSIIQLVQLGPQWRAVMAGTPREVFLGATPRGLEGQTTCGTRQQSRLCHLLLLEQACYVRNVHTAGEAEQVEPPLHLAKTSTQR